MIDDELDWADISNKKKRSGFTSFISLIKQHLKSAFFKLTESVPRLMFMLFFVCVLLLTKESNLELWQVLNGTLLEMFFLSSGNSAITLSILTGVLSGFFIWFFDVYIPTHLKGIKDLKRFQLLSTKLYYEAGKLHNILSNSIRDSFRPHLLSTNEDVYQSLCDVLTRGYQDSLGLDREKLDLIQECSELYLLYIVELNELSEFFDHELSINMKKLELNIKSFVVSGHLSKHEYALGDFLRLHGCVIQILTDKGFRDLHDDSNYESREFKSILRQRAHH